MPELPEVEIVRRGMENTVLGRKINSVQINRYDLRMPIPQDFGQRVSGKIFNSLGRRGKYIVMDIGDDIVSILHLGMSGRIRIFLPDEPYEPRKHDHIVFNLDNGACFAFEDPRRFGMLYLTQKNWQNEKPFISMGREPLDNWCAQDLLESVGKKRSPIKAALLDQGVVAGLGNIYVCEALFRACVHPQRTASSIIEKEALEIVRHSRDVLEEAIEAGGSTLKDYQHTDGTLGYFQHKFSVYGREGEDCNNKKCSSKISRLVQAGRSTFYCPSCQQ